MAQGLWGRDMPEEWKKKGRDYNKSLLSLYCHSHPGLAQDLLNLMGTSTCLLPASGQGRGQAHGVTLQPLALPLPSMKGSQVRELSTSPRVMAKAQGKM